MRNTFAGPNSILSTNWPWPRRDNSDEALIAKVAAGNRLAMQVLYARHHTRVHRFLLRWTGNAATAEHLTAEVFASVWRHAERFDGSLTVSTLLIAIARRKAQSESPSLTLPRLRSSEARGPSETSADTHDDGLIDPADDGEILPRSQNGEEGMRRCLMRLPREHREIIDLVYYHGKSEQEIAGIVGISCDEVRSRMLRARRRLSELAQAEPAPAR